MHAEVVVVGSGQQPSEACSLSKIRSEWPRPVSACSMLGKINLYRGINSET